MQFDWKLAAAMAATVAIVGCDGGGDGGGGNEGFIRSLPPASITTSSNAIAFAQMSSAPGVFGAGALPIAVAQFAGQQNGCPTVVDDGTSVTVTGGCTDTQGQTWSGSARSTQTAITYNGLSVASTDTCNGTTFNTLTEFNGSVTMTATGAFDTDLRYDIDGFDSDTCQAATGALAWAYTGTSVAGTGDTATWSGSGVVGMQGISVDGSGTITGTIEGMVEAETVAEVLNDTVCNDEALSGTTTMTAGTDVVVITYDGASDCDPTSTARWSLNGTDQGELVDISCSVSRTAGGPALGFTILALGAALLVRRRARATGSSTGTPGGVK